jgi:hypothetical protein
MDEIGIRDPELKSRIRTLLHDEIWYLPVVFQIRIGFSGDPDRAFYLHADPDPGRQTNADPDPDRGQTLTSQKVGF